MSQSDYLKHKKTAHILKYQKQQVDKNAKKELKGVLGSGEYTDFKRYELSKSIINTNTNYNELVPEGKNIVFGMELDVSFCPVFDLCEDTSQRNNRVLLTGKQSDPGPCPKAPIYIKNPDVPTDPINKVYVPNRFEGVKCKKLYSKYSDENAIDADKPANLQCKKKANLRMKVM